MKKISLLFVLFFISCSILFAVPAIPHPVTLTQPNGDTLTVRIKGDERINWYESMDGYTLLFNQAGYLSYAQLDEDGNLQPSDFIATNIENRSAEINSFLSTIEQKLFYSEIQKQIMLKVWQIEDEAQTKKNIRLSGQYKTLCALVQFPEKSMTIPTGQFESLMNQLGYTANGTGSVRDFFKESSYNQFDLIVTLCGPYTAPNAESYYYIDKNHENKCPLLARWLAEKVVAEPAINFTDYDSNNDGEVDGFHFIFAGRGQEAGGGVGTIWSHKWGFSPPVYKNGKYIEIYSCSPELYNTQITTIGVICHEMTHAFGEMDYYDTGGGGFTGTGEWDVMAGGSWNGSPSGNRPPHHNMYTKIKFGWVNPVVLNSPTTITDMPNSAENPVAYKVNTTTNNEYFLLENRRKIKFDTNVPGNGLLIYRVHSQIEDWAWYNAINNGHPQGMYPVCASATVAIPNSNSSSYGSINSAGCPFPGSANKTSFTDATTPSMKSWANANTNKPITNITRNTTTGTVSFDFMGGGTPPCSPITNLAVDYTPGCASAQLTWNAPTKSSEEPNLFPITNTEEQVSTQNSHSFKKILAFSSEIDIENIKKTNSLERDTWLTWCNNDIYSVIGAGNMQFGIYNRFATSDLSAYTGQALTKIKFYPYSFTSTYPATVFTAPPRIRVYVGGSFSGGTYNPGTMVADVAVTNYNLNADNTVSLPTPIVITGTQEIWFGVFYTPAAGYPGTSANGSGTPSYVEGKSNIMTIIDEGETYWGTSMDFFEDTSLAKYSWYLFGWTETIASSTNYNIYRDDVLIKSNHTGTSYTDIGFNTSAGHTWAVAVVCPEGGTSNKVSVTKTACSTPTTYTITASAGTGGKIAPTGNVTVNSGNNQRFDITPNTGYRINQVLVNGINNSTAVTNGYHIFNNVTANHAIAASFTPLTYTITLPNITGANVAPYAGSTSPVNHGESFSFTVNLEPNYTQSIITVKTNGTTLTPSSNIYKINNITTNQVVTVDGVIPNVGIGENEFSNILVYSYSNSIYIKNESHIALKSVEIMDMIGRQIYQSSITENETAITLNIANGIYSVRLISQDENVATVKVSINR